MKHEIPPYHYELPDGTISVGFDGIYQAFIAGARATWRTGMKIEHVKVFNSKGAYVPSWSYCDDCNYSRHICPGCGDDLEHEDGGVCEACMRGLEAELASSPPSAQYRTATTEAINSEGESK
jgi:hypothetical protein